MDENSLQFCYINEPTALNDLVGKLSSVSTIAMDIEADSFHHYYPKVCLIQMSFNGSNFIIDPLVNLDLSPLLNELKTRTLIFHDAGYDLRMMKLSLGFEPVGEIFDTMLAGKLLKIESLNLAGMLQKVLNVTISKSNQKADWSKRPLPEHLLRYAALDTRHLLELAKNLEQQLHEQDLAERHQQMCRGSVQAAMNHIRTSNPEKDWRVKGSSKLTPRQLAFLKQLWLWREKQAQHADLPPFRIFHNERMIALAIQADAQQQLDFETLCGKIKHCKGQRLASLCKALEKAFEQKPTQWPKTKFFFRRPRPEKEPQLQIKSEE